MLDIGGGSTEIMWLDRREPLDGREPGHTLSMPLGVVTLSESFGGRTDATLMAGMVAYAVEQLAEANRLPAPPAAQAAARLQMLGTSGTVDHPGRGASGAAPLRPPQGRRHVAAVRGHPDRVA